MFRKKRTVFKSPSFFILVTFLLITGGILSWLIFNGNIDRIIFSRYYQPELVPYKRNPVPVVRFGFITDVHGKTSKGRIYAPSLAPMLKFNERMKSFGPDFVIEGGDFIEGTRRTEIQGANDFVSLDKIFNGNNCPTYHVLGNHDLRSLSRPKWLELTSNESAYYYFDVKGYRFFVLDANYYPTGGKVQELFPGVTYNRGYITDEQLIWLESLLNDSDQFRKIVFIHHPPLNQTKEKQRNTSFPVKAGALRDLLAKFGVKAVFSGHIEEKYHENIEGVDYYVTPGFHKDSETIESEFYEGVFTEVEAANEVKVKMHYIDQATRQYVTVEL